MSNSPEPQIMENQGGGLFPKNYASGYRRYEPGFEAGESNLVILEPDWYVFFAINNDSFITRSILGVRSSNFNTQQL